MKWKSKSKKILQIDFQLTYKYILVFSACWVPAKCPLSPTEWHLGRRVLPFECQIKNCWCCHHMGHISTHCHHHHHPSPCRCLLCCNPLTSEPQLAQGLTALATSISLPLPFLWLPSPDHHCHCYCLAVVSAVAHCLLPLVTTSSMLVSCSQPALPPFLVFCHQCCCPLQPTVARCPHCHPCIHCTRHCPRSLLTISSMLVSCNWLLY